MFSVAEENVIVIAKHKNQSWDSVGQVNMNPTMEEVAQDKVSSKYLVLMYWNKAGFQFTYLEIHRNLDRKFDLINPARIRFFLKTIKTGQNYWLLTI